MPEASSVPFVWSAYEHEHIERGSDWFWALGVIAVSAALTSILFSNVLFAILILIASITMGLVARRPPELHEFEISERGIRTGNTIHPFENIIAFWIDEEEEVPLLLVDTTAFMSTNLIIPLEGVDIAALHSFLSERAEEVPLKEPLAHKILEFFGF